MKAVDIVVGRRALVQSGADIKEHAKIKGINKDSGMVIVSLSNGEITEINPEYIIKDFKS